MKKILIYGSGGLGREVQWLIERINQKEQVWQIEGYLDDNVTMGTEVNGYFVLGGIEKLKEYEEGVAVVCAIGSPQIRKRIIKSIKALGSFEFPNLIDPDVQVSKYILMGEGNIICAGNVLTINIRFGDFVLLNLSCTIGHDVVIDSFVTIYPGVNISGCVKIGHGSELGTGSKVIQGIEIGNKIIIGAGGVVIKNITQSGTYVGIPVKKVK